MGSIYKVYSTCWVYDREFKREWAAVRYAEKLNESNRFEAIWEITEDGDKIQRDDLL